MPQLVRTSAQFSAAVIAAPYQSTEEEQPCKATKALAFAHGANSGRCLPDCLTHAWAGVAPVQGWSGAVSRGPVVPVSGGYTDPALRHWPLVFNPCRER